MPTEQAQIEVVFGEAAAINDAAARAAYLDQACRDSTALRERVEALLAAHDSAASFLPLPDESDEALPAFVCLSERPGAKIGRYKLLEQIGEGGFGVVFMAEQEEPVRRRVALKIIKAGMDTRQVVARFEAERQALAMMEHPNIARVFDAGATDTGRPYFVMELVKGIPITDYCDQQKLNTDARLKLFIAVCSAVQHAHQKGIIHRDLKPSNVLVTLHDDKPVPKIIDFGIAKATLARLTDKTLFTEFRQLIGTPAYMSPEQAQMIGLDVDTRSDVYSLGVLLYELMTGTTPFDSKELLQSGYDEMRRIIREVEPPSPSTRLSQIARPSRPGTANAAEPTPAKMAGLYDSATIAANRSSDPKHLSQQLRGDLDWIVMRCLEKDRTRRYPTANSLAQDVERYLNNEVVEARPPSAVYRFRKFARRNKTLLATSGAIATALVVGLGISLRMYVLAETENARAQVISDLLQEMLESADAARAKGAAYTVRELLDEYSTNLDNQLIKQPEVEADIRATMGRAYGSLRLPKQAQSHLERALELRRRIDGPQSIEVATLLVDYASNLLEHERRKEAELQVREALQILQQKDNTGGTVFRALVILQNILLTTNRERDAENVTEQALRLASESDEVFPEQANLLQHYAELKIRQGHFTEGERLARQSVALHRRLNSEYHPDTAFALRRLGTALVAQKKLPEAEAAVRESLAIFRRQFVYDHPYVRSTVQQLAKLLDERGDQAALESLENEEVETAMQSGSAEYRVRIAQLLLEDNAAGKDRKLEARQQVRRAIEEYSHVSVREPKNLDRRLDNVGHYLAVARVCRSASGFDAELDKVNQFLNAEQTDLLATFSDPADTVDILYSFALARLRLGDESGYQEACKAMSRVPDVAGADELRRTWVWCLAPHPNEELMLPLKKAESGVDNHALDARHSEFLVLGGLFYRVGRYHEAAGSLEKAIASYPDHPPTGEGPISYPQLLLTMSRWQLGQHDRARQLYAEAVPHVDEQLQSPLISWNRFATLELLRAEAEALIGRKQLTAAPQP